MEKDRVRRIAPPLRFRYNRHRHLFTGVFIMIQDIAPHRLDNHYDPDIHPAAEDFVLCFRRAELLCGKDTSSFPRVRDFEKAQELTYLFSIGKERFFLPRGDCTPPDGFCFQTITQLREKGGIEKRWLFAAMTGKHLSDWYTDTQFCGRCGRAMRPHSAERAMTCPACGYTAYPRIMPAVIVGVTNGDQLLLTKYRTGYRHNALIAGFTEIGETLEETVAREVMEEAGIRVANIRYYKSQPWGVANDILVGFFCDVQGETQIRMDENELGQAVWTPRAEIELQPDDVSLTNEMMRMFRDGLV